MNPDLVLKACTCGRAKGSGLYATIAERTAVVSSFSTVFGVGEALSNLPPYRFQSIVSPPGVRRRGKTLFIGRRRGPGLVERSARPGVGFASDHKFRVAFPVVPSRVSIGPRGVGVAHVIEICTTLLFLGAGCRFFEPTPLLMIQHEPSFLYVANASAWQLLALWAVVGCGLRSRVCKRTCTGRAIR